MTERLTETYPCDLCNVEFCYRQCYKMTLWAEQAKEKLAEYETAEKDGRLVVFPCKVRDVLFCFSRGKIYPFKVRSIRIYEERVEIELWYAGDEENLKFWHITIAEKDIRYKLFFTHEESEKVLKEMEEKQDE